VATLSLPDVAADSANFDHARRVCIYGDLERHVAICVLIDSDLRTLQIALGILDNEHVQDIELMIAGSPLTLLSVLVHFVAVQRYYVARITAVGLKE